ncbi:MAG: hypothetical protein Q7S84_00630, partial [bacterium]|nr:hypothetical protein [bacterium]
MKRVLLATLLFSLALVAVPSFVGATTPNVCTPQAGRTIVTFPFTLGSTYLRADQSLAAAESAPVAATLPAGTYAVALASYDDHTGHGGQSQMMEQFFVSLRDGSNAQLAQSAAISDLPEADDNREEVVNTSFTVPSGVATVVARHAAYPLASPTGNPFVDPQSIYPICASFTSVTSTPSVNHPPVITGPTFVSTTVSTTMTFMVSIIDPDSDPLVITTTIPAGATFST